MTPVAYVAHIDEIEPGAFAVTFPDVPEAISQGDSREEAEANAADALAVALDGYLELGREFPPAAARKARAGAVEIPVDPAIAARAVLRREMARQRITGVALAARLGTNEKAVRRILTGKGASLNAALEALRAVGVRAGLAI